MTDQAIPVEIRGIFPASKGCALFLGNDSKVFVMDVRPAMGEIIEGYLRPIPKERPLAHDLMVNIFDGFNIDVDRVIISEFKNSTFYARLVLNQRNEVSRKLVEVDARPSDCLALATVKKRPIYVAASVFEQVEDMSEVLERFNGNQPAPRW